MMLLSSVLLSVSSSEDAKFGIIIDLIKTYEKPTAVTAFLCQKPAQNLKFAAKLASLKIQTTVRIENGGMRIFENSPKDVIIVADLDCPQMKDIFGQANKTKMFRSPHRWLVIGGPTDTSKVIPEQLENLDVLFDSEVIIARKNTKDDYQMYLIYKTSSESDWMLEYYGLWTKTYGIQKSSYMDLSTPLRRKNLAKQRIPVAFNVDDNETGIDLKNCDDRIKNSPYSTTRCGYHLILALYQFLNATRVNVLTDNWGYFVNGSWNGIIGCFARGQADLSGSGFFMTSPRIEYASYLSNPIQTSIKFVFREPPLSYQNNLFLLPFNRSVWCSLAGFVVVIMVIIYVNAQWEFKKSQILNLGDDDILMQQQKINLSDVAMTVVGAISQQGSFVELKGSIGRTVMFLLFVVFLFLFTAYAASIVALLQSSSKQIRTLSDLLNSKLELGVENHSYNIHYFTTAKDPVRKAIYETKVAPRGSKPKFMGLEDGVKMLQKHPFAFNMDVGIGYKIVDKYFYEHEKCGLQEIAYIPLASIWITGRKDSQFTEIFKIGLSRLREHGVGSRVNSFVYAKKPVCSVSGASFGSVSIIDIYPCLLMLLYGIILAFLVLATEILVHRQLHRQGQRGLDAANDSTLPISSHSSIINFTQIYYE